MNVYEWITAMQSGNFASMNGATSRRLYELAMHFRCGKQKSQANRAFNLICTRCGAELDMFLGHDRTNGDFVREMDLLLQSYLYLIDADEPKLIYPVPPRPVIPSQPAPPRGPPALPGPQGPPTGYPCTVETRWPGSCLTSSTPPSFSNSSQYWW